MAALVGASGAAFAVNKVCPSGTTNIAPCSGTNKTKTASGNDILVGTSGPDYIKALSGNDTISGGAGNDTYSYKDGFGTDTLIDPSGSDVVDFSRISAPGCGTACLGMDILLIPDWASATGDVFYNQARVANVSSSAVVSFGSSVIEKAKGSSGNDRIEGGEAANMLMPGPGGNDYLIDMGGYPGRPADPDFGIPALPALDPSADTYKGFVSGFTKVQDEGGSGDVVDLRQVASYDAHFDVAGDDLVIHTTSNADGVVILGYFTADGRIEKIVFSDTTITGFERA